jgi:hypothetical protein
LADCTVESKQKAQAERPFEHGGAVSTNHSDVGWLFEIPRPTRFGGEVIPKTMIAAGASSADGTGAAHVGIQNRATHLTLSKDGIVDINSKAAVGSRNRNVVNQLDRRKAS